jgi:hypothetical protein
LVEDDIGVVLAGLAVIVDHQQCPNIVMELALISRAERIAVQHHGCAEVRGDPSEM